MNNSPEKLDITTMTDDEVMNLADTLIVKDSEQRNEERKQNILEMKANESTQNKIDINKSNSLLQELNSI